MSKPWILMVSMLGHKTAGQGIFFVFQPWKKSVVVRKRTTPPLLFIATILGIGNPSLFLIFKPFNVILVPRPLQVDLGQVAKFHARSCSGQAIYSKKVSTFQRFLLAAL